jgi:hypothetical protein
VDCLGVLGTRGHAEPQECHIPDLPIFIGLGVNINSCAK